MSSSLFYLPTFNTRTTLFQNEIGPARLPVGMGVRQVRQRGDRRRGGEENCRPQGNWKQNVAGRRASEMGGILTPAPVQSSSK